MQNAIFIGFKGPNEQALPHESPPGTIPRSKNEFIVSTAQEGWKWNQATASSSFTNTFLALPTHDSQTSTNSNESIPIEKSRDINNQDIAVDIGLAALLRLHMNCDNSSMYKFVSLLPKDTKADIMQRLNG